MGDPTGGIASAALTFDAELQEGRVTVDALIAAGAPTALRPRFAPAPLRLAHTLRRRRGRLGFHEVAGDRVWGIRRRLFGDEARRPPRILVRVDEFPLVGAYDRAVQTSAAFGEFHQLMGEHGVPYLLAVPGAVAHRALDPRGQLRRPWDRAEREVLSSLGAGVELAVHGLDHRTRRRQPRQRSELAGLGAGPLAQRLDATHAALAELGTEPAVFVPPFNRFDRRQLPLLCSRYRVICGGPETVPILGAQPTPTWLGDCVYLPSYPPFYGRAAEIGAAIAREIERARGCWVPLVLHWEWEQRDGWRGLRRLLEELGAHAVRWQELLDAAARAARLDPGAGSEAPTVPTLARSASGS